MAESRSRSWLVPQAGQVHCLSDKLSPSFANPTRMSSKKHGNDQPYGRWHRSSSRHAATSPRSRHGKVAELPAPAAAHDLECLVREDDGAASPARAVRQLPQEVTHHAALPPMASVGFLVLPLTVAGTPDASREVTAPAAKLSKTTFGEPRGWRPACRLSQRHALSLS